MARRVKNIYVDNGKYVELHIYDRNDNYKHTVLFSSIHLRVIQKNSWSTFQSRKRFYAHTHVGDGKYLKMHRLIAEHIYGESKESVDHINRNGLDNRDENLRYADYSQQSHNKDMFRHNTSGVKGVSLDKKTQKWRAEIDYHKKRLYKGFVEFEDAVKQRKEWEYLIENNLMEHVLKEKFK
jgi:hypothetical protein